jgi:methionine-rich copper-binding protein CopC
MKSLRLFALLGIITLASDVLLAQPELTETIPVNGSIIRTAPAQLELNFSEEVQLLKLAVSGINSKMVPTKFKPTADVQTHFTVPLPGLYEDAYVVAWTVLGKDGREVEGKLTFIVDADAVKSPE